MGDVEKKQQDVSDLPVSNEEQVVPEEETFQISIKVPVDGVEAIKVIASPREAVQDIKQSIMESPETCAHSCFYLTYQGKRLNDYMELGEIEGLSTVAEFELVQDVYNERDVRVHINRLRDLLGGPYKPNPSAFGIDSALSFLTAVTGEVDEQVIVEGEKSLEDIFSEEPVPEHAFTGVDLDKRSELSDFVPATFKRLPPQCIQSLTLSGWNPVPHARRLKGDLMYIIVHTLEGEQLNITAGTQGFFVNNSSNSKFDADPKSKHNYREHSLIILLQKASAKFKTNFAELQDFITRHHMLEVLPMNSYFPNHPWAVQEPEHVNDPSRPADALLNFGTDAVDSLRDWNDELQSHRELPRTNLQERVLRERLITKVLSEFTDAAVRGAMAAVNGSLIPVNPLEPEDSHMYVYNNIFLSKGNDGRGTFESIGADEAAHVATGKDLEGVKVLNGVDPSGLYTLGSVIVDYKGIRVVAQSIVPGIFRRQDENSIVYGSADNGDQISADEKFHVAIGAEVANTLHLAEHAINDKNGDSVSLYTSVETKGLLGADGRRYLLDLYRLNPVDIVFQETECVDSDEKPAYPHKMTLLRPELMSLYWEHKFREWVKAKQDVEKEARKTADNANTLENNAVESKPADEDASSKAEDEIKENKESEPVADEELKVNVADFKLSFNPDAFTIDKHAGPPEELKAQEEAVRNASKFLNEEIVPSLVLDFASYSISPLDGESLTKAMHRRGINMRYLGKIAELVSLSKDKRIEHIQHLAVQEMIVRCCKRLLRHYLSTCPMEEASLCIAHFLNCLIGTELNSNPKPVLPAGKTRNDLVWATLTPLGLQGLLRKEVLLRFRYRLDEGFIHLKSLPTMREICLRTGIQISARDYRFNPYTEEELASFDKEDAVAQSLAAKQKQDNQGRRSKKNNGKLQEHDRQNLSKVLSRRKSTFIPEDILNILPTIKQAATRSLLAEETFEAGKMSLAQGHRQLGLELLLESLTLHEQTYGFLHPETSKCYATLAMIYHHGEDREAALDLQRKAVIAAERTCGVDHPETLHHYLNLGLFEHAAGRTKLALRYLRHALYYWDLLFGPGHPDSATADNNAGVMLQSLRDYTLSTKFFERACVTQETILGKNHVITATGYHVLAKAYTLQSDFKRALNAERVAYGVFEKKLGVEDPRTKESDMWLKELTKNALILAQNARAQKKQPQQQLGPNVGKTAPVQVMQSEMPTDQVPHRLNGNTRKEKKSSKKRR